MDPNLLYKIIPATEWKAAEAAGSFGGSGIDLEDGFIHLSSAEQVSETLQKYFANQTGLVLLGIDAEALGTTLQWEPSRGGALFPHVYGEIPVSAVKSVEPIEN
ncbi:hypothetical protein LF1_18840 [Rubripirellula obstinata]|uniref:Dihydroorotate dehydrogenase n=1 Tax=Rubripirellula obstinata TaxID=406547 RepID=A0A5B1CGN8_9BACT|nr:DUF952 domain-containing protein [Rubripirellula obstinata]KAA1259352.1 hypothetical protein LF1_18840 [Rubripirellula obstinata]